ncbi:hypothetical protein BROUX41_004852 [Berkeleyomyces rouxiae]
MRLSIKPRSGFNFSSLPAELRLYIIELLASNWAFEDPSVREIPLAPLASVNSEWQYVIERFTFSHVSVDLAGAQMLDKFCRRRKKLVNLMVLKVTLPEYPNNPCEKKETWKDKVKNNKVFRDTIIAVYTALSTWDESEVRPDGFTMTLKVWSASDFNQCSTQLWQERLASRRDIGALRFSESYLDIAGFDDEESRFIEIPHVFVVGYFSVDTNLPRVINPAAISEMVASLRLVRTVYLGVAKHTEDFMMPMLRWTPSIESVYLIGRNTDVSWRELPHENMTQQVDLASINRGVFRLMNNVKCLHLENLVRIKNFLGSLWPTDQSPAPFLETNPLKDISPFYTLMVLDIQYSSLHFPITWEDDVSDLNDHPETQDWRQRVSLGCARLAMLIPNLRLMKVWQRPLMYAGKHSLEYKVETMNSPNPPSMASLEWASTFDFQPWDVTLQAWAAVAAKNAGVVDLQVKVSTERNWRTDGQPPKFPALVPI